MGERSRRCIELLKGYGRADLVENMSRAQRRMLNQLPARIDRMTPRQRCRRALDSGCACELLAAIIERRGEPRVIDDYGPLPQAPGGH